jgi:hypothetical protein
MLNCEDARLLRTRAAPAFRPAFETGFWLYILVFIAAHACCCIRRRSHELTSFFFAPSAGCSLPMHVRRLYRQAERAGRHFSHNQQHGSGGATFWRAVTFHRLF